MLGKRTAILDSSPKCLISAWLKSKDCPSISTEDTDFLVIDRKGNSENLVIHKFDKEKVVLKY